MNHRHHIICVMAAVGLGVWFLLARRGNATLAGVSLALLICPLVMGAVMWILMRQTQAPSHPRDDLRHDGLPQDKPVSAGRR